MKRQLFWMAVFLAAYFMLGYTLQGQSSGFRIGDPRLSRPSNAKFEMYDMAHLQTSTGTAALPVLDLDFGEIVGARFLDPTFPFRSVTATFVVKPFGNESQCDPHKISVGLERSSAVTSLVSLLPSAVANNALVVLSWVFPSLVSCQGKSLFSQDPVELARAASCRVPSVTVNSLDDVRIVNGTQLLCAQSGNNCECAVSLSALPEPRFFVVAASEHMWVPQPVAFTLTSVELAPWAMLHGRQIIVLLIGVIGYFFHESLAENSLFKVPPLRTNSDF